MSPHLCPGALGYDNPASGEPEDLINHTMVVKKTAVFAHVSYTEIFIYGLNKITVVHSRESVRTFHPFESLNLPSVAFLFWGGCQEIFLRSPFSLLRYFEQRVHPCFRPHFVMSTLGRAQVLL